jgi:protein SCO1/2
VKPAAALHDPPAGVAADSGHRRTSIRASGERTFRGALCALMLVLLGACGARGPAFQSSDITGASFGQQLELTATDGRPRRLDDFRGKAVVVFFGYTQCPDVCPATLATLADAMKRLGRDADRVQVLFVTVDPERDTPALLAQYVPAFDARFLGLYGDADATARAAKAFRIIYQKVPGATPGTYTMDHSAGTFIYDPQGRLRLYVANGQGADVFAHDLRALLDSG